MGAALSGGGAPEGMGIEFDIVALAQVQGAWEASSCGNRHGPTRTRLHGHDPSKHQAKGHPRQRPTSRLRARWTGVEVLGLG